MLRTVVPKAPVDEDGYPLAREGDVDAAARKVGNRVRNAKAVAGGVQR
jgi:hypothetical protein